MITDVRIYCKLDKIQARKHYLVYVIMLTLGYVAKLFFNFRSALKRDHGKKY